MADELTPCVGRWDLFDSTRYDDHLEAASLCETCPATQWCEGEVSEALTFYPDRHGIVVGTWAGILHGKRGRPRKEKA